MIMNLDNPSREDVFYDVDHSLEIEYPLDLPISGYGNVIFTHEYILD